MILIVDLTISILFYTKIELVRHHYLLNYSPTSPTDYYNVEDFIYLFIYSMNHFKGHNNAAEKPRHLLWTPQQFAICLCPSSFISYSVQKLVPFQSARYFAPREQSNTSWMTDHKTI